MSTISHTKQEQHLLISGGGIGGLTAALALAQKGVTVDLFEQATEFKEVGAGLQVGPNAFRIFEQLGVTDKISALATFPESVTLMDATQAEPIVCMPLGADFLERFKYPYGLMHRADLHKVLLTACQGHKGITLHTNSKITAFSDSKDRVNATLSSGAEVSGQGLVGADGLWSLIRQKIVNDGEPRLAGHVCYRAVVPIEKNSAIHAAKCYEPVGRARYAHGDLAHAKGNLCQYHCGFSQQPIRGGLGYLRRSRRT